MLRTRFSLLQVQVFAHAAGVTSERPPARAFCLVLQIIPKLALKQILGKFQSLVRLRTRLSHLQVQVLAHTAGAISLRTPARALFVLFSKSIPKAPKQILGKI